MRSVTRTGVGGVLSGNSQPSGTSVLAIDPACAKKRINAFLTTPTEEACQCWPASSSKAMRWPSGFENSPWSRMRTPSWWPLSITTWQGDCKACAKSILRCSVPVTHSGVEGSCMECKSSRCVALATNGLSWRARVISLDGALESSRAAFQTRLKSSSI